MKKQMKMKEKLSWKYIQRNTIKAFKKKQIKNKFLKNKTTNRINNQRSYAQRNNIQEKQKIRKMKISEYGCMRYMEDRIWYGI